jgi:hypothetical protein
MTDAPLSPDEFAECCRSIVAAYDGDKRHRLFDRLVCLQLERLGYGEGTEIFRRNVDLFHRGGGGAGRK